MFVHGRRDGQVRNGTQGCEVEGAVMGGTILTYQSGTVEAEHDVQVQQCHVVDDIVEGPLGEGAVDVAERQQPVLGHTS